MAEENKKPEKSKKVSNPKDIEKKIIDLKIEILKQPQKRKGIKREIARLLTMKSQDKAQTKLGETK